VLALPVILVLLINFHTQLPKFIEQNKIFGQLAPRLVVATNENNPRFAAWLVGLKAIEDRHSLLGA